MKRRFPKSVMHKSIDKGLCRAAGLIPQTERTLVSRIEVRHSTDSGWLGFAIT